MFNQENSTVEVGKWVRVHHKSSGDKEQNRLRLVREPRKCQHLYHYCMHPELGLMHVRMQSWFPFNLQVWCNGREMLVRRLHQAGIGYAKIELQ